MRLCVCLLVVCALAAAQVPPSSHIWIITEENHSYEELIGNPSMPYFNGLAANYGLAVQYYATQHNSLSSLMWLVTGQKVTDDDNAQACFDVNNVVRQLLARNLTWRAYQEDLPYAGFQGLSSGNYVRRHNPLIDFTDTCAQSQMYFSVPFSDLAGDIAHKQTPNYAYITPNLQHDAHDGSLAQADSWLSGNVPAILGLPEFKSGGDGLLFIVFDEGGLGGDNRCSSRVSNGCGGRVATLLIGPQVKQRYQSSTLYSHPNLLHTVCEAMRLSACPMEGSVFRSMSDFFNTVDIATPFSGATVASPVSIRASASGNPVNAMQVYVDNQLAYQQNAGQINASIPMSGGHHYVVVQSWDTAGGIHKSGVDVNVQNEAIVVSSPAPNAVLGSSVSFKAAGQGGSFNSMSLFVDGVEQYKVSGSSLDTTLSMSKGSHKIAIKGVTSKGEVDTSFSIKVIASTIKVASPKPGASIYSPIPVYAVAQSPNGVSAMQIYVDNQLTYEASGWGLILPLSLPHAGQHDIVIQSWDNAGKVNKKALTISILPIVVTISTPRQNQNVGSPVAIKASASGPDVATMQVYVDNNMKYQVSGNSVNTSLSMTSGKHYLVVKAWDSSGGTWTSSVNINVN